ncbi:MAG: glycosyltransferase [Phycisphaeraceae bacterium]
MNVVLFYHSLISDWNHGNAHFLRGIARELQSRGSQVRVFEPEDGWSLSNLISDCGEQAVEKFHKAYPELRSEFYRIGDIDLDAVLKDADLVIVHEWNDPELVARIGRHREVGGKYRLLFHDTHHRSVSDPDAMAKYDLSSYDGVLAFGNVVRDIYLGKGWAKRAWTWHEAADVNTFHPRHDQPTGGDLVWIGNWGDDERTEQLREYLLRPVKRLGLKAKVYGVRYPDHAIRELEEAGIEYGGYLPNCRVPEIFARYRVTVHIPREYYTRMLPGIPTIRPFEAMACGIPLICSPWQDSEHLFRPGQDYLVAHDGAEMEHHIERVLQSDRRRDRLIEHGLETILKHHTCTHRVERILEICRELGLEPAAPVTAAQSRTAPAPSRTATNE